jgi:type IV fimbrial biogenesis protein FimT
MHKQNQGFTLIELVVVIAIIALLTTVALPTFRAFTQNNRSEVTSDLLVSSLNLARSEAFSRKKTVSICGLNEAQSECVNSTDWVHGWVVFEDTSANGLLDPSEIIIKIYNPFGDSFVPLKAAEKSISFNRLGFPTFSAATYKFEINPPGCTGENNRNVIINNTGVIDVSTSVCS